MTQQQSPYLPPPTAVLVTVISVAMQTRLHYGGSASDDNTGLWSHMERTTVPINCIEAAAESAQAGQR